MKKRKEGNKGESEQSLLRCSPPELPSGDEEQMTERKTRRRRRLIGRNRDGDIETREEQEQEQREGATAATTIERETEMEHKKGRVQSAVKTEMYGVQQKKKKI